ncbi:eukaryotic translation initiation factor 3 subunit 10 [Anopheles sinensis]|uniref:Eukaryotic translation initiation factor 3 subunit 10 n=1 Tax=Anopheles sinensis TaxID=74873 RepID=A0A084W6E9_ANOSI|nr:eukaryotic translation initiation factor 3 subunit 10 [Anopheles sinensis]
MPRRFTPDVLGRRFTTTGPLNARLNFKRPNQRKKGATSRNPGRNWSTGTRKDEDRPVSNVGPWPFVNFSTSLLPPASPETASETGGPKDHRLAGVHHIVDILRCGGNAIAATKCHLQGAPAAHEPF